ncbi:MAG: hypothetical protein AAF191_07985 [Verrucomicrobiota bacterium]
MTPNHRPTPEEARGALAMADSSAQQVRITHRRDIGTYLLLWGTIYCLVPLCILFCPPQHAVWLANTLVLGGVLATVLCWTRTPIRSHLGFQLGAFWWITASFAIVWLIILGGENFPRFQLKVEGRQTWAFGITVAMQLYLLMGILAHSRMLIVLGIGVTAFTLAAFFVAWEWTMFWTWMILFSGIPLLLSGLTCKLSLPASSTARA